MTILVANAIRVLQSMDVIKNSPPEAVNATSLDIHLGRKILVERNDPLNHFQVVDYSNRDKLDMIEVDTTDGYTLYHGQFILAHTIEEFFMPDNVSALLRTKSSMGRIGLEHMDAGWVDPGFHGVLTLEFKNMTQNHGITIRYGDPVGQLIFFTHENVGPDSYRITGRYNGSDTVEQVR